MLFLKQNPKKTLFILCLIILLMLPVIFPLLRNGFFISDDGEWMIIRFSAFYESLRDGQFPVRLLQRLNHGFGYPVANFLYPEFMYLGVPFHIIGLSFTDTIKLLMGISMLASVFFTYLWLRHFFALFPSIMGSLFYGYAPYHLYDLYTRGSLGELLAFAIIPFVFWQIERKSVFWSAIGIGMLLVSHNTLSVFFFCLVLLYMALDIVVAKNRRETLLQCLLICVLGVGVSAFFWIPAVYDLQFTVFGKTSVSNWEVYFSSLSLVGITSYLVFTVTLLFLLKKRVKASSHRLTILFLFVGLFATFFATSGSAVLWNILPVSFVQFPFRFLSITIIVGAFLTAFLFSEFSRKERILALSIFILLTVTSLWQTFGTIRPIDKPDSFYATNLDTTTVHGEYMPRWVKKLPAGWQNDKVITEKGKIIEVKSTPNTIFFVTNGERQAEYVVRKVYFPGWKAAIDGTTAVIEYQNPEGLITVMVPKGKHEVSVIFGETPLRLLSDIISLVCLVALLAIGIFQLKRSR